MKNFETILQDVKRVAISQYERGFDYITLALANALNKNLRRTIIKQGKNPDGVPTPQVPTRDELIKGLFSNDYKRPARAVSFVGSLPNDWVKDDRKHPILKSREKAALAKFSDETADLLAESTKELNQADSSCLLNEPACDFDGALPVIAESEISTKPVVPKTVLTKKRYSIKTGQRIKAKG